MSPRRGPRRRHGAGVHGLGARDRSTLGQGDRGARDADAGAVHVCRLFGRRARGDRPRQLGGGVVGDLVGYATWPNEVVAVVQERGIPTIAGNYDEGVGLGSDDCGCAYVTDEDMARGTESIAYTNATVTDDDGVMVRHRLGALEGGAYR
mgnify:CR=1 FL=1